MNDTAQPTTTARTRGAKPSVIDAPAGLDEADGSRYIGMSRSWLRHERMHGRGPAYYRIGRTIRYRIADLDAWLANRRVVTAA